MKTNLTQPYKILLALILLGAFFLLLLRGISCPIRLLTGISCPGCGITRACKALLRLDFHAAFYYHPLAVCLPVMLGYLLLLWKRKKNILPFLMKSLLLFFVVYLYRLWDTDCTVVTIDIKSGLLYRFITSLFHR